MRFLLVLAFAAVACAGTILPQQRERLHSLANKFNALESDLFEKDAEISVVSDLEEIQPSFIISWQIRRAIRKMQKQMPCGWPEYGVPPLAPLKTTEKEVEFKRGIVETLDKVFRLRVDGLDDFKIKKFKLNMITSKITFDFRFKNVKTSAQKYETDTLFDALRQLGLSVEYEGDGTLDFELINLRVAGVIRYKIPILWGSAKITSMKTEVSLEQCNSAIGGFLGNGAINQAINSQIENVVVSGLNDNQDAVSDAIEDNVVPRINALLKGNNFWDLLDYILSSSEGENEDDPIVVNCVAPADPWA